MTPTADYGAGFCPECGAGDHDECFEDCDCAECEPMQATVRYMPASDGRLVILKPCWSADNGYETACFVTKDEAIDFACKRWRLTVEQIRVVSPNDGSRA